MSESIIPALISGAFTIISILLSSRFMTDPLQAIEAKQRLINGLPNGPRKTKLQNKMELYVAWAIEYGDMFVATGKFILWSAATLALFIMAGSITILTYIGVNIDTSICMNPNMDNQQVVDLFPLVLNQIKWTFSLMFVPILIGVLGFALTSFARMRQIERLGKPAHSFRSVKNTNNGSDPSDGGSMGSSESAQES